MNRSRSGRSFPVRNHFLLLLLVVTPALSSADETSLARDPKQPVNDAYTAYIT